MRDVREQIRLMMEFYIDGDTPGFEEFYATLIEFLDCLSRGDITRADTLIEFLDSVSRGADRENSDLPN